MAEVDGVRAHQGGEAGGRNRFVGRIQRQPLGITAGEQAVDAAHVVGERQCRTRRQVRIGFERTLQLGRDFYHFRRVDHAMVVLARFGFQHDFQSVGTREVRVDGARTGIELGVVPYQVAAFYRVTDFDLHAQINRDNTEHDDDRCGNTGRVAIGDMRNRLKHLGLHEMVAALLSLAADNLLDILGRGQVGQHDRGQEHTGRDDPEGPEAAKDRMVDHGLDRRDGDEDDAEYVSEDAENRGRHHDAHGDFCGQDAVLHMVQDFIVALGVLHAV